MAGNKRRKQENSGVRIFLYVVVVLVLLGAMGYLFYYSRSQTKERQAYIKELESKEAATKGWVAFTQPEEPTSEENTENTESTKNIESTDPTEIEESAESTESTEKTESIENAESSGSLESESGTEIAENAMGMVNTVSAVSTLESASVDEVAPQGIENPNIMILNGTGKSGVAAYWKRLLLGKGLTNVVMADYKGTVEDHTVIYVAEGSSSPAGVRELFSNAEYLTGELEGVSDNIQIAAGQSQYSSYQIWIVVGRDDALHD